MGRGTSLLALVMPYLKNNMKKLLIALICLGAVSLVGCVTQYSKVDITCYSQGTEILKETNVEYHYILDSGYIQYSKNGQNQRAKGDCIITYK
jgi:hypothetical protein